MEQNSGLSWRLFNLASAVRPVLGFDKKERQKRQCCWRGSCASRLCASTLQARESGHPKSRRNTAGCRGWGDLSIGRKAIRDFEAGRGKNRRIIPPAPTGG